MSDLIAANAPLHLAVRENDWRRAQYLLEHKANPNIPDSEGYYPLHRCKSVHMMALLLRCHATVYARNKHGSTPLHCAVCDRKPALVELLLEHKADPNAADKSYETSLHVAAMQQDPETVKLLLQARADPNVTNLFLQKTPVHNAARSGCFESTKLLLEAHAAVDLIDAGGSTALIHGVHFRNDNVVNILLDHGANIHVKRNGGFGLLHIAAEQQRLPMVHNLVVRRADVFQKDPHGQFPIAWAKRQPELKAFLQIVMWEETVLEFCKGVHPRLGSQSSIQRAWTAELSERNLIWLIGLFLKPSSL
jgi:ankyrin repeat protein